MTVQQFLRVSLTIALVPALQAGPSPKGPQSGLLGQIGVVQSTNEQSAISPDLGRAHVLPLIGADAVLPFQQSSDGTRFTLLRFGASGSAGVRLHFRNMHLSSGAHVFVYGQGRDGAAQSV